MHTFFKRQQPETANVSFLSLYHKMYASWMRGYRPHSSVGRFITHYAFFTAYTTLLGAMSGVNVGLSLAFMRAMYAYCLSESETVWDKLLDTSRDTAAFAGLCVARGAAVGSSPITLPAWLVYETTKSDDNPSKLRLSVNGGRIC